MTVNEGMLQTTLQAVECMVCKTLHRANSAGYMLIVARIFEPGKQRGNKHVTLGDAARDVPAIVCINEECILRALGQEQLT